MQTDPGSYSVINQQWRYIQRSNGDEELYKVDTDPGEWNNVASNPEFINIKKELASYIPKSPAQPAKSIKARTLRPVYKGESFEWVDGNSKPVKKGKKRKK